MATLLLAEHDNAIAERRDRQGADGGARSWAARSHVLVAGPAARRGAEAAAKLAGRRKVLRRRRSGLRAWPGRAAWPR